MELDLKRIDLTEQSSLGVLSIDGEQECYTVERPWMDGANLHGKSAILPGRYLVTLFDSPRLKYQVLLLHDVPGRESVEVHIANQPSELEGCIAPGTELGVDRVEHSKIAFLSLREKVRQAISRGEEVWLTISFNLEEMEIEGDPSSL